MEARRDYGQPCGIAAGATREIVVDGGARLTIYVSGACTLQWSRGLDDQGPQTWHTPTGPERIWPVDVPDQVHLLNVIAGGAPIAVRLAYSR